MRKTRTTIEVLEALMSDPAGEHYGYGLLQATTIKGGSLYPILDRLEKEGWVVGSWKESPVIGRPRRRCYRLTGLGIQQATMALSEGPTAPVPQLHTVPSI